METLLLGVEIPKNDTYSTRQYFAHDRGRRSRQGALLPRGF
jgi:hypothetical protein